MALLLPRVEVCKPLPLQVAKLLLPHRAPSWEFHAVVVEGAGKEIIEFCQNFRLLLQTRAEHSHVLCPALGNQGHRVRLHPYFRFPDPKSFWALLVNTSTLN